MSTYFITAIDTDAGKSIITGYLARYFKACQKGIITMKLAQTGCNHLSEDIETHRNIMGEDLRVEDLEGKTCSYIFKFPASPHLAAEMEERAIDPQKLINDILRIQKSYSNVLVEGVGGLMVPITRKYLVADFLQDNPLPVILVTSGRLGSINHTLLTLEVLKSRGIDLYGVVYNCFPVTAEEITHDSKKVIRQALDGYFPQSLWAEFPIVEAGKDVDLKACFKGWFEK